MKRLETKPIYKWLFPVLFGIVIALALGEIGARIYFFGTHALSYYRVNSFVNLFDAGLVKTSTRGLPYELKPDLNTYYKLSEWSTNSEGFRDKEFIKDTPNKCRTIGIIGDSFTMGQGVEYEQVYHTIVENQLNENSESEIYQLLNFGVAGYNLNEYETQAAYVSKTHSLEEIVIGFCGYNDHFLPEALKIPGLTKPTKPNGFWKSYFWWLIKLRLHPIPDISAIEYEQKNLRFIEEKLSAIQDITKQHNIKLSLLYLATNPKPQEAKQVQEICLALGIEFADASKRFPNEQSLKFVLNEIDTHPNRKAHSLFAAELLQLLMN